MSEFTIQLTRKQQEILLRGLRYVRSSAALDPKNWSEGVDEERQRHYRDVAEIESLLNGATIVEPAAI